MGIADHMQRALRDRASGGLVEVRVMMRLQHRKTRDPAAFIRQRDPNDASWIGAVLHTDQIALIPVKAVDAARNDRVGLR